MPAAPKMRPLNPSSREAHDTPTPNDAFTRAARDPRLEGLDTCTRNAPCGFDGELSVFWKRNLSLV
jgi:hypothetical protein